MADYQSKSFQIIQVAPRMWRSISWFCQTAKVVTQLISAWPWKKYLQPISKPSWLALGNNPKWNNPGEFDIWLDKFNITIYTEFDNFHPLRKQLLEIAKGNPNRIFEVDDYDQLNDQVLKEVLVSQCSWNHFCIMYRHNKAK